MTTVAPGRTLARLPAALAGLTVLLQIAYPLVLDHRRDVLTVVTVCTFFLASASHALHTRGVRFAGLLVLVATAGGLVAEAVGTRTGYPFGHYSYDRSLGWTLFAVPVVIPLAWAMFAYPCLIVGRRLASRSWQVPFIAAGALASWDLFLDPQMVDAGHWRWTQVDHTVPGIADIPVSNFAGWALVALLLMSVLHRLTSPDVSHDDAVPAALFLWTYASSVLANAVFFDRPGVALIGGVVMGAFALPYARRVRT